MFCKNCGTEIGEGVNYCPKCGVATTQSEKPSSNSSSFRYQESGRGTLILVLGILSVILLGPFTGIPAWVMGSGDRNKIKFGIIPVENKAKTTIGMILGIIGTFGIFIFIFFFSALSTGVSVFNASSMQANRDALIADGTNITSLAQQYYRKPLKIGGGGNSFKGFEIPESLVKTENGSYHIIINNSKSLTITCVGKELGKDGRNFVRVVFVISPHRIVSTDIRN